MKKLINLKAAILATIVLATAIFVGCDKKSDADKAAPADSTAATNKMGAMADKAKDMSAGATAKAQQLLDQGMQYVKDNKMDLAQKSLDQLDAIKAQLPAEWAAKVDQLRSAIASAKAAGGASMPGK